jgi:hypothetical protein
MAKQRIWDRTGIAILATVPFQILSEIVNRCHVKKYNDRGE